MAINYEKMANTTQRLIEANGRPVVVTKKSETPVDTNKPWRAADPGMSNSNETQVECIALFKGTEQAKGKDGVIRSYQVAEIAAKSAVVNDVEVDLTGYDLVTDGSVKWTVERVDPVKPGNRNLLWKLYLYQ